MSYTADSIRDSIRMQTADSQVPMYNITTIYRQFYCLLPDPNVLVAVSKGNKINSKNKIQQNPAVLAKGYS